MRRVLLLVSIGASAIIAALIDLATSAELVGSILFTFPLALCALSRSRNTLWITLGITILLTITAQVWGFHRTKPVDHATATANRALLIASLVMLTVFIDLLMKKAVKIKQQQEALAIQNAQLEVLMSSTRLANRELESFSYSVAHDLRAPLRGMNGFSQMLLDTYQDKLDSDGKDWLNEIRLNATNMAALIDALLALARVTRTELKPESGATGSVDGGATFSFTVPHGPDVKRERQTLDARKLREPGNLLSGSSLGSFEGCP